MFHLFKRAASGIANAAAGKLRLFVDTDGLLKSKNETGVLTTLGDGIVSITLVNTAGNTKTYRITRQSGATFDYTVMDGQNGADGAGSPATAQPTAIQPDAASSIGTATARYALEDHRHAIVSDPPVAIGSANAEGTSNAFARADHVHAGVTSFNGRQGAVSPQQSDYDGFFTTPAEAAAAAPVQSFNGRQGAVSPQQSDYDAFFTTPAEAAAAAPVQAVNGKTGNVFTVGDYNTANTARSASFSTAATVVASQAIGGGTIAAGAQYYVRVVALVTNTTATSNLVINLRVGATTVATLTQALGATARTNQPVEIEGLLTFTSATAAEGYVKAFASAAVAFNSNAANAAAATVSTAANTDVNLQLSTSAATSTLVVTQVWLERLK